MSSNNQRTVDILPGGTGSISLAGSRSNTESLKKSFPGTPHWISSGAGSDALTARKLLEESFKEMVLNGEVNDEGHTFGTFNRDYNLNFPDTGSTVISGPAGLPGNKWQPNPASSPTTLPQDLPDPPSSLQDGNNMGNPAPFSGPSAIDPDLLDELQINITDN